MNPNQSALCSNKDGNEDAISWISVCPMGLWRVQQKQINSSLNAGEKHPRLGSVCHVRVQLKTETSDVPRDVPGQECGQSFAAHAEVLQVPLGAWTTVTMGEGQCDVTEKCLESMKSGDKCEILLVPLEACSQISADSDRSFCATVELKTFTPGKESWELSSGEKMNFVKSHKERGSVRFRSGDVWGAGDSYSRALKLIITLYGHVKEAKTLEEESQSMQSPSESLVLSAKEYKTMKAELHSNLSLCQLKLKQPEHARNNASKATELYPMGMKAWYRLGQACLMVSELEEAKRAFKKVLELQPDSSAAMKALKEVAIKEKETNRELAHRLSKMFT
uniref:FKBP prolyl isomerase like n=1 Tax=Neogobius melanostomus TaxID=47308 RepID=A0A8C6TJL4_9GOBI